MIQKNVKRLDDLAKGIKHLLLENRCSFSKEEKVLLNDCLEYLKQAKKINDKKACPSMMLITKVVEILLRLFSTVESLKDQF